MHASNPSASKRSTLARRALIGAGLLGIFVGYILLWELLHVDSDGPGTVPASGDEISDQSGSPESAGSARDVVIEVHTRAVEQHEPYDYGGIKFVVWGEGWQSRPSLIDQEGLGRTAVSMPAGTELVGIIVWGGDCFTELQAFAVSRREWQAGVLKLPPVVVRRKCALSANISNHPSTADPEPPHSLAEKGSALSRRVEGVAYFVANQSWLMEPSEVDNALERVDALSLARFAQRVAGQVPVRRQMNFTDGASSLYDLPEGVTVALEVRGDGIAAMKAAPTMTYPRVSVTMRATAATTLRVIVTDRSGGRCSGVSCSILRTGSSESVVNPRPETLRTGYTDAAGEWLVSVPSGKSLRVLASSSEGIAHYDVVCDEGSNQVSLTLSDGNVLSGRVVDDSSGPVIGLRLQFIGADGAYRTLVTTDQRGEFAARFPEFVESASLLLYGMLSGVSAEDEFTSESIAGLTRMKVIVPSSGNQFALVRRSVDLRPGSFDFTFTSARKVSESTLWLRGHRMSPHPLLPDALAVADVDLAVSSTGGTMSLEAGLYRLRALEASDGSIQASHYVDFEVRGERSTHVVFALEDSSPFHVKLVDGQGRALVGQSVSHDGLFGHPVLTDAGGVAFLGNHARGTHTVSILSQGWFAGSTNEQTVTLSTHSKTITIVAEPSTPQVTVRSSVADIRFRMSPVSPYSVHSAVLQPDQSQGFVNLAPGTWHVQAWTADGSAFLAGERVDIVNFTQRFEFLYESNKFVRVE